MAVVKGVTNAQDLVLGWKSSSGLAGAAEPKTYLTRGLAFY